MMLVSKTNLKQINEQIDEILAHRNELTIAINDLRYVQEHKHVFDLDFPGASDRHAPFVENF